jgi:hypothetical protein
MVKLEIDPVTEHDIRVCMDIFNKDNLGDDDTYSRLQKAAMQIAISLSAKLQTEDTFNTISNKD